MLGNRSPQVDEGTLLALLDGELSAEERSRVEDRLAECAVSAARLDELRFLRRRATAALAVIDAPAVRPEMPAALREAARSAPVPLASIRASRFGWMGRRTAAVAAGLTLLVAAGAYALPGSPVRDWVGDGIDAVTAWLGGGEAEPDQAEPSRVSVEPADGSLRITIIGGGEGVRLNVRLTDEPEASVVAGDANFHVEPGVIEVSGAAGEITVTLPRGAASGSVMIDETEVVRFEGGELRRTTSTDPGGATISLEVDG